VPCFCRIWPIIVGRQVCPPHSDPRPGTQPPLFSANFPLPTHKKSQREKKENICLASAVTCPAFFCFYFTFCLAPPKKAKLNFHIFFLVKNLLANFNHSNVHLLQRSVRIACKLFANCLICVLSLLQSFPGHRFDCGVPSVFGHF